MEAGNPSDEELWVACRKLPSDWEPHGNRRWHGRLEDRPDCDTCCWFVELLRTSPDWGACANQESERAGLLTYREQGCWQHEPVKEHGFQATRPARCDFIRRFEAFLREQAADFIEAEVRRANDPSPGGEPPATIPEDIRETPLFLVVRRLLRHAAEDFSRPAFARMVASARKDSRRYWDAGRRCWGRIASIGEMPGVRLPGNMRGLEEKFWNQVAAAISEAFRGQEKRPARTRLRRAG